MKFSTHPTRDRVSGTAKILCQAIDNGFCQRNKAIQSGACAVGSALLDKKAIESENYELTENARILMASINEYRAAS
jgi:hypothetical protein